MDIADHGVPRAVRRDTRGGVLLGGRLFYASGARLRSVALPKCEGKP